jgi:5-methylthioadenosine/S-adenosylhomocysteine deaminase
VHPEEAARPSRVDTLLSASWVIPIEPHGVVLEDYAVVVDGGLIVDVLPAARARARYEARSVRHLAGHVLLPGLVNAHTHAAMTLLRGYADDLPVLTWLREHIWPAEARWVSREFVRDGTRLAAAEMIRGGTTCFADMYFFPDAAASAAEGVGLRAVLGLVVLDVPTRWARDEEGYLARAIAMHAELAGRPLVSGALAPHAPYSVSDHGLERVAGLAEELDVPVHMHVQESEAEIREHEQRHGERPLRRLDRLDLIGPRLAAVHMACMEPDEVDELTGRGAQVVHCPESNLKLASGVCPAAALLAAGVEVGLGTDGAASNNDLDMWGEMRTAALLGKWIARDAGALPAATALHMATLGSARCLGLADRIGSLEPGKDADLVAVDLSAPSTQPVFDPVSQLVYASGRDRVTDVWVAGRPLLSEGHLQTLDEAEVLTAARTWKARLADGR